MGSQIRTTVKKQETRVNTNSPATLNLNSFLARDTVTKKSSLFTGFVSFGTGRPRRPSNNARNNASYRVEQSVIDPTAKNGERVSPRKKVCWMKRAQGLSVKRKAKTPVVCKDLRGNTLANKY